jgi:hypothetical protein
MAKLNRKPSTVPAPVVVAPLRDGTVIVVLEHDAIAMGKGLVAQRFTKWEAAQEILADYPTTARPGCNPNRGWPWRATASGTIVCK